MSVLLHLSVLLREDNTSVGIKEMRWKRGRADALNTISLYVHVQHVEDNTYVFFCELTL